MTNLKWCERERLLTNRSLAPGFALEGGVGEGGGGGAEKNLAESGNMHLPNINPR